MARSDISSTTSATPHSTVSGGSDATGGGSFGPEQRDEPVLQTGNGGGIVNRVKESAAAQLTSQKNRGIDALGSVAQAIRSTTKTLRDEKHDAVAGYAEQAAGEIERWSQRLKEKDIDELIDDMHRLARRQPAVFIGSAFAIGVLAARFLKSSTPQNAYDRRSETRRNQYRYSGESPVATVHDTGGARVGSDYRQGGLADAGDSDTAATRAAIASSTDPGRGTRTGGSRRSPARTERS
jgi:hypothetical protein